MGNKGYRHLINVEVLCIGVGEKVVELGKGEGKKLNKVGFSWGTG